MKSVQLTRGIVSGKRPFIRTFALECKRYAQTKTLLLLAFLILATAAVVPGTVCGSESPHGNYLEDTDVCLLCHRTHISTFDKLLIGTTTFEAELCYTCHGPERAGSIYDVKTAFDTPDSYPHIHPIKDDFNGDFGTRRYEETGPHVTWDPPVNDLSPDVSWYDYGYQGSPHSGGYTRYTSKKGATATFTFRGSYFRILAWKNPDVGTADVYIDGESTPDATINFYSSTNKYQVPVYTKTNLSPGVHTIELRVVSGYVNVDAYVVSSQRIDCHDCHDPHLPSPTLAKGVKVEYDGPAEERYEETSPAISYAGDWTFDGTYASAMTAGYKAVLNFSGTNITWYSRKGYPNFGIARITLRNSLDQIIDQQDIDTYSESTFVEHTPLYTKTDLPSGSYSIEVYVTGTSSNPIAMPLVYLDAFEIINLPEYTELKPVKETYQLCFKCHTSYADSMAGITDKAKEFNPENPSYHPVEAIGKNQGIRDEAFTSGWSDQSTMPKCNCHPRFPTDPLIQPAWTVHGLENEHLLSAPYEAVPASDPDMVCYDCHSYSTYYLGDGNSRFGPSLVPPWTSDSHSYHAQIGMQAHCENCHQVHGSTKNRFLIRDDMILYRGSTRGACSGEGGTGIVVPECHAHATFYEYSIAYP